MPSAGVLSRGGNDARFWQLSRLGRLLGVTGPVSVRDEAQAAGLGWAPALALQASLCVLACGWAVAANLRGDPLATPAFYLGCAVLVLPAAFRLTLPISSREERLSIVLVVTVALFLIRLARAPTQFVDHDEFLHWLTTINIEEQRRLFTPNPLLPVSALYPGLELATTALAGVTGLSIFAAATVLLGACRLVFMATLFFFFERVIGSARAASLACLVYMGSSTFLVFDSHFSYESLAVMLAATALLCEAVAVSASRGALATSASATLPMLAALSVTHHTTAFFLAALISGAALFSGLRLRALAVAGFAVLLPLLWSRYVGDATVGYLGPVIHNGLDEVERLMRHAPGRQLFVSDAGVVAPAWQRYTTLASVALVSLGLAFGFFRSLRVVSAAPTHRAARARRRWGASNPYLLVLTLVTLAFPLSVAFRLTRSGWEIGNRMGALSFFGIAPVIAISIVLVWQGASKNWIRALGVGLAAATVAAGGIVSGEGPDLLAQQHFQVSADHASIEPMGLATARWAREWLNPGNLFAADRINRLLLATYGRQDVATTLEDPRDSSVAILSPTLGPLEKQALRDVGVQYVLADLRITSALPVVGVYFDGSAGDRDYDRAALAAVPAQVRSGARRQPRVR